MAEQGAQQSAAGHVLVRLTTIDAVVEERGIAPSFIKMGIEGAESSALRGAAGGAPAAPAEAGDQRLSFAG